LKNEILAKAQINCTCGCRKIVEIDEWMIGIGHVWCPDCKEKLLLTDLIKKYTITLTGNDNDNLMEKILQEICNMDNVTKVVNAMKVTKTEDQTLVFTVEPWLWQLILPLMEKYSKQMNIKWEMKI